MSKWMWMFVGIAIITVFWVVSGCEVSRSHPPDIAAFTKPTEALVSSERYLMFPPDEITVQCTRIPELHGQGQQIRPDGKISFESIGEVYVAGKTPAEVAGLLKEKATDLYKLEDDKQINVRISLNRSKMFYVLGQVRRPGPMPYTGRDTVFTALALAIPEPTAWESRVQVIRPSLDPAKLPHIFEVKYNDMQVRGDLARSVLLHEGDIIYVPPTPLAKVAMVLEEFLRPIARAFQTQYYLTGGASGAFGGSSYQQN
ncbi:polysaccharide biosynthesis/export family protein [Planctomycetota bacterium]